MLVLPGRRISLWQVRAGGTTTTAAAAAAAAAHHHHPLPTCTRSTTAKMEINKEHAFNPIKQDTSKGKLRFYHSPSLVNYGAIPQTYEDPAATDALVSQYKGDGDPLDVIDVSDAIPRTGDVYAIRVVGALAMVDGDELDWKIVGIAMSDPLADEVRGT